MIFIHISFVYCLFLNIEFRKMSNCCSSVKKKNSDVQEKNILNRQINKRNSENVTEIIKSDIQTLKAKADMVSELSPQDLQIYEGNFENVPLITQSEIRIFLSSTFAGNIIKNF